jgi:hypothetical protein
MNTFNIGNMSAHMYTFNHDYESPLAHPEQCER